MTQPSLANAYDLTGPDACLRLYAGWAESYDQSFAAAMEYRLPAHVAALCMAAGPPTGAVLDVGAGTGLCAQELQGQGFKGPIDAVDLSPEMLKSAATKGIYRALYRADITRTLDIPGGYAALVSSGTFTSGHVGPQALGPLLGVTAPGGLLVLSVNLRIWDSMGFAPALAALGAQIDPPRWVDVPIYGAAAERLDPDHAADHARIVILRKAGHVTDP